MIGVAARTFDQEGSRIYRGGLDRDDVTARRISRTATLDGGCLISDMGASVSDKNITIEINNASSDEIIFARYITETYGSVTLTTEISCYSAAPESCTVKDGVLTLKFLIEGQLS